MRKYTLDELLAQCDPGLQLPVLPEWEEMVPVGREIIDQKLIWMLGDVHGQFDHVLETVRMTGEKPAAVIFLGDLQCPAPFSECVNDIEAAGIACWAIPGNHDTDSEEDCKHLFHDPLFRERNLHGRVVEIAGLRVAGLGGVFRGEIWYPRPSENAEAVDEPAFRSYDAFRHDLQQKLGLQGRLSKREGAPVQPAPDRIALLVDEIRNSKLRKHKSSIFHDDYLALYGQTADILVCHEAPSCHPNGFQEIDALARSLRAKYVFHGHHHDSLNYRSEFNRQGFAAYGVSLRGITDMFGGRLRVGDEASAE